MDTDNTEKGYSTAKLMRLLEAVARFACESGGARWVLEGVLVEESDTQIRFTATTGLVLVRGTLSRAHKPDVAAIAFRRVGWLSPRGVTHALGMLDFAQRDPIEMPTASYSKNGEADAFPEVEAVITPFGPEANSAPVVNLDVRLLKPLMELSDDLCIRGFRMRSGVTAVDPKLAKDAQNNVGVRFDAKGIGGELVTAMIMPIWELTPMEEE